MPPHDRSLGQVLPKVFRAVGPQLFPGDAALAFVELPHEQQRLALLDRAAKLTLAVGGQEVTLREKQKDDAILQLLYFLFSTT